MTKILNTDVIDINELYNSLFPIGYIYLSVSDVDPSTLFGGTWERIKDNFLLCAGDTYAAGATGGEASHKLTIAEMPSHTHQLLYYNSNGTQGFGYNYQNKGIWSENVSSSSGVNNAGGDTAHNNMPPYLAVNVWKRTA